MDVIVDQLDKHLNHSTPSSKIRYRRCGSWRADSERSDLIFLHRARGQETFKHTKMSSMTASALLKSRIRRLSMLSKLAKTSDLIDLFPNGASVGWSGFTGVGYPK